MTFSDFGIRPAGEFNVSEAAKPQLIAVKMQALFMEFMLKAMEDSVEAEGGMFGNGSGSEVYRGMFRGQLAAAMSSQLQSPLEAELRRRLESSTPAAAPAKADEPAAAAVTPEPQAPVSSAPTQPEFPTETLPVAGRITSRVGWRVDPINQTQKFHRGTDIAAPEGTPIRAVAAGAVVESGVKGSYGNAVVIETADGKRMLYAHNRANLVKVGDRVEAGQTIAEVGATGRATGPHVHFEVLE